MSMEGKLPIGVGSEALDDLSRSAESRAPARHDVALGRRAMNIAVLKTKVEQALTENFAAVEDQLPGGAEARKARDAAIGRFGALGLPNRRPRTRADNRISLNKWCWIEPESRNARNKRLACEGRGRGA